MRGYHSEQKVVDQNAMKIRILPALSDNYMYLLMDLSTKEAAVVDPVEPDSVIKAVEEEGVRNQIFFHDKSMKLSCSVICNRIPLNGLNH